MVILPANSYSSSYEMGIYKLKNSSLKNDIQIIDFNNNRILYQKDSMESIALKALGVFLFNPIVLFSKIVFNLFQIGFDFAKVTIDSTIDTAIAIKNRNILKVVEIYITSRIDFMRYVAEDVISIVKAPFCAIGIQLAAIYTVFSPLRGRKIVADIEKCWNNHKNVKQDYRYCKDARGKNLAQFMWGVMLNRKENVVFYMAPCFQPVRSLKDKHVIFYSDI